MRGGANSDPAPPQELASSKQTDGTIAPLTTLESTPRTWHKRSSTCFCRGVAFHSETKNTGAQMLPNPTPGMA